MRKRRCLIQTRRSQWLQPGAIHARFEKLRVLSGDIERRIECRKVQIRYFLSKVIRQELEIVLVGLDVGTISRWTTGNTNQCLRHNVDDFLALQAL